MTPGASSAADLGLLLSQSSHVLDVEMTAALAGIGITPRSYCVLSKALSGDRTQSQLAELCGLDKTTMVVTIDELERSGLAIRQPSEADRRARIISVTPAGRRLVQKGRTIVDAVYDDILGALPADDRAVFVRALTNLAGGRLSTPPECDKPPRRRAIRSA